MNAAELITYLIQHNEFFPDVDEITPDNAQDILDNLDESVRILGLTPEDFATTWNRLIRDPSVKNIL